MNGIRIAETIQSGKKEGSGQGVAGSKELMEGLQLLLTTKTLEEKKNNLPEGKKFKELRGQEYGKDFLCGH